MHSSLFIALNYYIYSVARDLLGPVRGSLALGLKSLAPFAVWMQGLKFSLWVLKRPFTLRVVERGVGGRVVGWIFFTPGPLLDPFNPF
jgi:hypothetical protein